ncbi:M48 family metallopeptidase [Anaerolineales bacterium HSG25]|nr:M48 family metallopeptidase [Anaerolineales bacterium HSG25]
MLLHSFIPEQLYYLMNDTSESTSPPIESSQTIDPQRQETAKEYAAIGRKLFVVELVIGLAYVLIWIVAGISPWLRDQIYQFTTATWLSVPLFAVGFALPQMVLTAPLDYYSGFVLPHRYGQSNQTLQAWLIDQAKGLVLAGVLGIIVLEIIYLLLSFAPDTWWLWTAAVMLIFSVLLSNLAPVLIFPLFFTYHPLENEALVERLTRLADQAGAKVQGVYTFDMSSKTSAANAALMGLGNTRRIVLGDTLVENFTIDEIETVLAHELGHHVHKDLVTGIAVQSTLTLIGFYLADVVMRWGIATFGYHGLNDPATLPLLMVAMMVFGLVTMPLGNIWSRWREVAADTYALETTRNPQAFISAMTRLANQNLADTDPPTWVEFLLHSHPSISKRVALAEAFEG